MRRADRGARGTRRQLTRAASVRWGICCGAPQDKGEILQPRLAASARIPGQSHLYPVYPVADGERATQGSETLTGGAAWLTLFLSPIYALRHSGHLFPWHGRSPFRFGGEPCTLHVLTYVSEQVLTMSPVYTVRRGEGR